MITGITLHNFRAFENVEATLRPITVLVGPNNSGKSSIIAAIRLLVQTVESPDTDVPLLLNGVMGDFGTFKDLVYGNHRGRPLAVSVSFAGTKSKDTKIALEFKYRVNRREIILREVVTSEGSQHLLTTAYNVDSERQVVQRIGDVEVPASLRAPLSRGIRINNFVPWISPIAAGRELGEAAEQFLQPQRELLNRMRQVSFHINRNFRSVEYLGALRTAPQRTYLFTGERRRRVGPAGENAAAMLAVESARRQAKGHSLTDDVSRWLARAQIASALGVEALSDRHYEIRVRHPVTGEYQNLADVGYGSSQVLPVLVAGYSLEQGEVLLVEEPEIHLHPFAQAELGEFFLSLYARGVQSVIETHSEHMILRLQQLVAAGRISAEDLIFHYVNPIETGRSLVQLEMNERGAFTTAWPRGFFPERLEEARRLAQIRSEKS